MQNKRQRTNIRKKQETNHLWNEGCLALDDERLHVCIGLFVGHFEVEPFPKLVELALRVLWPSCRSNRND